MFVILLYRFKSHLQYQDIIGKYKRACTHVDAHTLRTCIHMLNLGFFLGSREITQADLSLCGQCKILIFTKINAQKVNKGTQTKSVNA